MAYDIFLVDADNTILDFHASSLLSVRVAFESFGVEWKDEYGARFTRLNDSLWEMLERKEITRERLINERFPRYLQELGFPEIDAVEYNKIFLESLALKPVYMEGAEAFLAELKKRGRVYIVTNGTTVIQRSRFEICKLNEKVDGVFVSESIGFNKPAKGYTDYVLSHIPDFSKARAVWIGDSLSADIKAANEANIASIWFNPLKKRGEMGITPDHEAENFAKILQILGF